MPIAERIEEVRGRIASAAERSGRSPGSIRLIAVSKGHPAEAVMEAFNAGLQDFGENYSNELIAKAASLSSLVPGPTPLDGGSAAGGHGWPERPSSLYWHYQGRLQTRKIRDLLKCSSSFFSVCRSEEMAEIEKRAAVPLPCLIEVNIAAEEQKNGVKPDDLETLLSAAAAFPKVRIEGLMTVPPFDDPPEPWFEKLRMLRDRFGLKELSMGMTSDFESAIEHGATMVRIGTAIFGERPKKTVADA